MKVLGWAATAAALCILVSGSAHGAALSFDDTLPSELIHITANDFEGGLFINGSLFQSGLHNPASGNFAETNAISFSGTWINPTGGSGTRTIWLIESGTTSDISDILTYSWTTNADHNSTITGTFTSDTVGSLGTVPSTAPPGDVFTESSSLGAVSFTAPFFGGSIASDFDTPEPSSLFLVGAGITGLLAAWNRKRVARRA